MVVSSRMIAFRILAPCLTTAFGPIVTLGPIFASESTFAVGCIKTSPIMFFPDARFDFFANSRYIAETDTADEADFI